MMPMMGGIIMEHKVKAVYKPHATGHHIDIRTLIDDVDYYASRKDCIQIRYTVEGSGSSLSTFWSLDECEEIMLALALAMKEKGREFVIQRKTES